MDEKIQIEKAKNGDKSAFEQLVLAHQGRVFNLCLQMVQNRDDAMDLSQEAFLRAWRSLGQYQGASAFSTWLYRLTRNLCVDFLRKNRRIFTVPLTKESAEDGHYCLPLEDPTPTPEEAALKAERREMLLAALARLSPEHREILYYRVADGLCYEEIAEILHVSLGTVKSRLCRARLHLKQVLEDGNYFEDRASNSAEGEVAKR